MVNDRTLINKTVTINKQFHDFSIFYFNKILGEAETLSLALNNNNKVNVLPLNASLYSMGNNKRTVVLELIVCSSYQPIAKLKPRLQKYPL
jgi:hypothetical protein